MHAAGIALWIFDEVFVGSGLPQVVPSFQSYFGVQADMVTYGKTLGGALRGWSAAARRG
ncbi:MAG: hypothetical protein R3E56_02640 [Burkholderiaceae bacterium]